MGDDSDEEIGVDAGDTLKLSKPSPATFISMVTVIVLSACCGVEVVKVATIVVLNEFVESVLTRDDVGVKEKDDDDDDDNDGCGGGDDTKEDEWSIGMTGKTGTTHACSDSVGDNSLSILGVEIERGRSRTHEWSGEAF